MTFTHPETGELLSSREDFQKALADVAERMQPLYRLRRELVRENAEHVIAAALPPPTRRTPTQEKVAHCPRCGGVIPNDPTE